MTARIKIQVLLLVLPFAAGCVERKMSLRSDPPGAVVYVVDERVGVTPCETTFSHYGTRRVVLEYQREDFKRANNGAPPARFEAGFKRIDTDAPLSPPWYQWPFLDLITEVLVPFSITDRQEFVYALEPADPLPEDRARRQTHRAAVLERAHALRVRLRQLNEEERRKQGLSEPEAAPTAGPGASPK
jgi:hypothetical protein